MGVLDRARDRLLIWWDDESESYKYDPSSPAPRLAQLLTCFDCASVWVGGGFGLLYGLMPRLAQFAALPFALSQLAIWARDFADDASFDTDTDTT